MNKKRIVLLVIVAIYVVIGSGAYWVYLQMKAEERAALERWKADNARSAQAEMIRVMRNRAASQRTFNDLQILYGDKLSMTMTCYQAAVSAYVADEWQMIDASAQCMPGESLCDKSPDAEAKLTKMLTDHNYDPANASAREWAVWHANLAIVEARLQAMTREITHRLDPDNDANSYLVDRKVLPAPDLAGITDNEKQAWMDELDGYLKDCAQRRPRLWSGVGQEIPNWMLRAAPAELDMQLALINALAVHQLPAEDKSAVGCLSAFNAARAEASACDNFICADRVPVDSEKDLLAELADLKAHQCSPAYASELVARQNALQPASP